MNKRIAMMMTIIFAVALVGVPAYASGVPSYDVEEIVITADAYQPAMTEETVEAKVVSPGKATTIPEILRQSAGIDIQSRGVAGDNQDGTVKLRGFDARRYTVLLNGRPINSAGVMGGQYIDWTAIPLNTVDRIQIIKGAKLASHGNTMGGVINIVTREDAEGGNVNILAGELGRRDYLLNYATGADKLNVAVTANRTEADAFLRNNGYKANQYGLRLKYKIKAADSVELGVNHTNARRGYIVANKPANPGGVIYDPHYPVSDGETLSPGGGAWATPRPGAFWKKDNTFWDFSYKHRTDKGFWQLTYWKNDEKRREVNVDDAGAVTLDRTVVSDKSDNIGLSGQHTRGRHTYGYGAEYKRLRYGYGWYDYRSAGASDIYPSQKVNLFGMYVDDSWQINKRWSAYVGVRYDKFEGRRDDSRATAMRDADESALSPKLNLSFRNNAATTTFISLNRLWRAPSMAEFYWWSQNYGSAAVGGKANPSYQVQLRPEKGNSYEVGVEHRFSARYKSKVTLYYQDIRDYINFQHTYPYLCYNIDRVKVWGAEWENVFRLDSVNSLALNYTNQHTKKVGVAASDTIGLRGELDYRPRHKVSLTYLYDKQPWQLRYAISYVGRQVDGSGGTAIAIGGYTVHGLAVVRRLDDRRTIGLYIDNLLDKSYVEQYYYPMPGRLVSVAYNQKL